MVNFESNWMHLSLLDMTDVIVRACHLFHDFVEWNVPTVDAEWLYSRNLEIYLRVAV